MLKATAQSPASTIQARIVGAAFETLRRDGYARASARAIARAGGFSQALVFYHFGSVLELLLEALDRASAARMERYREALTGLRDPVQVSRVAARLHQEDVESGHATVLAELFAASLAAPALRSALLERTRAWVDLAEELIRDFVDGSAVAALVEPRRVAEALVAFYLGSDLVGRLGGSPSPAAGILEAGGRMAALISPMLERKGAGS